VAIFSTLTSVKDGAIQIQLIEKYWNKNFYWDWDAFNLVLSIAHGDGCIG